MNAIYRWDPFRGLDALNEQFNRLVREGFVPSGETATSNWAPAVDIYETENELVVKADLAGRQREGHRRPRREQHAHHSRRAKVREEGQRGKLSSRGARLRHVHPQLLACRTR